MLESLRLLGRNGSPSGACPALYEAGPDVFLIVGWLTDTVATVEIPHGLLGFAEHDRFIGAPLTDTGRGTFILKGEPVTDQETIAVLALEGNETAVVVPRCKRTYFGAAA
ncbi:hypothetical protein JK358_01590 [Nocardia sp. 2]|uniref:Uncharacterized protein n=1 Tax=Nocardia acididurans TaxID=2802282 RepID=A0ABS1LXX3_9NOCA|nr:hypothetical protein [Nocardia acididurans]MBL1073079.1 hypothetical protein [Nocardia acididurans]